MQAISTAEEMKIDNILTQIEESKQQHGIRHPLVAPQTETRDRRDRVRIEMLDAGRSQVQTGLDNLGAPSISSARSA